MTLRNLYSNYTIKAFYGRRPCKVRGKGHCRHSLSSASSQNNFFSGNRRNFDENCNILDSAKKNIYIGTAVSDTHRLTLVTTKKNG